MCQEAEAAHEGPGLLSIDNGPSLKSQGPGTTGGLALEIYMLGSFAGQALQYFSNFHAHKNAWGELSDVDPWVPIQKF